MVNYKNSKADFVYDILCEKIHGEDIVKGMMYWYFLRGHSIEKLQDDMVYHSNGFYKVEDIRRVMTTVRVSCTEYVASK